MKINRPQIARQPVCRARVLAAALLLAALFPAPAAEEAREGRIEFSDGKVVEGKISLTSGSALKIQSGSQVRALDLDRVREIRQSAEQEEMDRNWRFKEAGQTAKEFTGEPYPVRYVKTTVLLAGGESFSGHLYSTVLYVESGETAQKVVLLSKQRGDEGQTLKSMIYPTRISFAGAAAADSATATLRLHWPGLGPKSELAALTRGELVQLTLTPSGRAGEFKMTSPLGREFFLAIKTGDRIVAGWFWRRSKWRCRIRRIFSTPARSWECCATRPPGRFTLWSWPRAKAARLLSNPAASRGAWRYIGGRRRREATA